MSLSEHFSRHEMECPCCGALRQNRSLMSSLEALRKLCGDVPIRVNSGFRCIEYNRLIGGVPQSKHLLGQAADIVVRGLHPIEVAAKAEQVPFFSHGGIGVYDSFVHVDVRPDGPARW